MHELYFEGEGVLVYSLREGGLMIILVMLVRGVSWVFLKCSKCSRTPKAKSVVRPPGPRRVVAIQHSLGRL